MYRSGWRDRVADENYLVICTCGHAEQHHKADGCDVSEHGVLDFGGVA